MVLAGIENNNTRGVGTYIYGSPEQIAGAKYDASTDLFSLGMILFEMCHAPFGTRMERALVMNRVRKRKYPSAQAWPFREKYPSVVDFINQLLDPVPANRPTAAEAVKRTDILTVVSMDSNKRMLRFATGRSSALHVRHGGGSAGLQEFLMKQGMMAAGRGSPQFGRNSNMSHGGDDTTAQQCILTIDSVKNRDGLLAEITVIIREQWPGVRVLQCGRRVADEDETGCILEFVLAPPVPSASQEENPGSETAAGKGLGDNIENRVHLVVTRLMELDGIVDVNVWG